jgi:3',5'-cyclic AMP phosphodiesterase CpdA
MTFSRIWDLRRGDADDNRTSPYGAGWRRLVFSTALEFSYLKAAVGLLILVVIPALLVGIAPSIVLTYGRHMLNSVAAAGRDPTVVALLIVAFSIGLALLVGRRFFLIAHDNLSRLYYTIVFPSFVVLREVFRTISERLPGMSNTQEHLYRRRRVGTVIAAVILGGAGFLLAMSVELSVGLQLIDVERVRPLAVAKAALGNAILVLGFSTAAASAFWLWRELTISGPVLDWQPGASEPTTSLVRVAHLSDLHVVGERYGYRMETGTHGPQGNRCVREALEELAAIHAFRPIDRMLLTGDITDAGTRSEWAEFIDLVKPFPQLRSRMLLVPGNHDTNIVDRTNTGRPDLPWSVGQALRRLRFVLAMDEIQGDRVHLVDRKTGALGPTLSHYLRDGERPELLRALAEQGSTRGRWEIANVWEAIFPLLEPASKDRGYGIILLDSNAHSNFSLTNAIGVVNDTQLRALKSVLRGSTNGAWLVLLHHQIVEYPVLGISLSDRVGLALMNAADVLAAIAPHASRILILHGHRHVDWIGTTGKTVLCSAPSVTLGREQYRHHFVIHEFSVEANGCIQLTANQRIEVSGRISQPHRLDGSHSQEAA